MNSGHALLSFILVSVLVLPWSSESTPMVHSLERTGEQVVDPATAPPSVDFGIVFQVPDNYRDPIIDTLANFGYTLSRTPRLAVSAMEKYGTWARFTLVPAEVIESGWQTSFQDEDLIEIVVMLEYDGSWSGYVVNSATLPILAEQLPTYFTHRLQDPEAEDYRFPWTSPQEWYKTQGWHAGYTANAIDFAPVTGSDPPIHYAVLGSRSGSIIQVCNDGYQKVLRIDHLDASTYYLHLDAGTVSDCILNASVNQGQFLGLIYNGTAFVNGWCDPSPSLQFNTACGCGTGPHLHFETTDRNIVIDGYAINDVANSSYGTAYQSSNARIDGCLGCSDCIPGSCLSSGLTTTGSSSSTYILYDDFMQEAESLLVPTPAEVPEPNDPVAPTGSLTFANGSPTVRTLNVILDLEAADEGSAVTQMRFSSDGSNWFAWEPYARSKAWQLANTDEQQTLYAQVQDEAGNISETMAASVNAVLNVELPSSPSYSIARSTFGMGGGAKSSPSYQARGTSGQAYRTGRMESTNYRVNSGYWAGSVCPTAEFVAGPTITTDGSTVTLSWAAVSGATSYNIYRDTTPFFIPTTSYRSTIVTIWDDPDGNAVGDPTTNYTYIVKPVNGCGESSTIYRLGAFDFGLTPGS